MYVFGSGGVGLVLGFTNPVGTGLVWDVSVFRLWWCGWWGGGGVLVQGLGEWDGVMSVFFIQLLHSSQYFK